MNLTLLTFLTIAVVTDVKCMKISNRLIGCGMSVGLLFQILGNGWTGALYFILNVTIPVSLLILLFKMHVLGAGDIKLFSVAGSFLTTEQLIKVIIFSFVIASILGTGKIVYKYWLKKEKKKEYTIIHFSIAIILAVVWVIGGV